MNTKKNILSALLIAIGLLLPVIFHSAGISSRIFLPMHIPVLMGGLLLGPYYGLCIGLIIPALSSLLTGMPPLLPILPLMLVELAAYGITAGLCHQRFQLKLVPSLVIAMLAGRIANTIAIMLFAEALGIKIPPLAYAIGGITGGVAGTIIQLLFIPLLIKKLKTALGSDFF